MCVPASREGVCARVEGGGVYIFQRARKAEHDRVWLYALYLKLKNAYDELHVSEGRGTPQTQPATTRPFVLYEVCRECLA